MGGLCRNCENAFGEWIRSEEIDEGNDGLAHLFECPECGHQWTRSYGSSPPSE